MKRKFYIVLFILAPYLISCVSEFRPEVIDPRLPDYSEEGLNTAGAYVDGFPWTARRKLSYFFIFPQGISGVGDIYFYRGEDSTSNLIAFEFGRQDISGLEKDVTIGFYLDDSKIVKPEDITALVGRSIALDGERNYGQLFLDPRHRTADQGPDIEHRGTGKLHIRHVKVQTTDTVVVSGTFGFDVLIDGVLHTVHSGRFDYEVTPSEMHLFRK